LKVAINSSFILIECLDIVCADEIPWHTGFAAQTIPLVLQAVDKGQCVFAHALRHDLIKPFRIDGGEIIENVGDQW
jgi:hypothetical protein